MIRAHVVREKSIRNVVGENKKRKYIAVSSKSHETEPKLMKGEIGVLRF